MVTRRAVATLSPEMGKRLKIKKRNLDIVGALERMKRALARLVAMAKRRENGGASRLSRPQIADSPHLGLKARGISFARSHMTPQMASLSNYSKPIFNLRASGE
jgi:hypothetical protein